MYWLTMQSYTVEVAIAFKKIQGLSTFIEQHHAEVDTLVLIYMNDIECIVQLKDHELYALINNMHFKNGLFDFSIDSISKLLIEVASWVE